MITIKRIIEGTLVAAGIATYYTAPANGPTLIKKLTFLNTDTTTIVQLKVYLVAYAGAAGVQNEVDIVSLQPLGKYECFVAENQMLQAGDFIALSADTGGLVNVTATGAIITN